MGRKPSGRVNFLLRVDKDLLSELREIAKVQSVSISDLIERKILELVKSLIPRKANLICEKISHMRYPAKIIFHSLQNENQAIQKIENLTITSQIAQIPA
ncbi:MAG: hypothetical protein QXP46_08325, partial [Archaeoglobaceae archaeon]